MITDPLYKMRELLHQQMASNPRITREGCAKILKQMRRCQYAALLLDGLCKQIRPTTPISSRAYAAQRVVEEWQGHSIGVEKVCDENEWLASSATALGLANLTI